MAIVLLEEPTGGAPISTNDDYNKVNALEQAQRGLNEYNNVLTEWETTAEPEIALGARIIHDGGKYQCQTANEAIAGVPDDGHVYIKITEAIGVLTASFVTSDAGYTYNPIKGGWYHADGTQLLPFKLFKYDSTSWKKAKIIMANFNQTSDLSSCQVYPHAALETILQDDSVDSKVLPAGMTYWNFGSPNMTNSAGVAPTIRNNVSFIQSTATQPFFSNRGCIYINAGQLVYSYTFGNEMMIGLRILPNFAYNVATDVRIMANCYFVSPYGDSIHLLYEAASDSWRLLVIDDIVNNYYALNSPAYGSSAALQVETSFFIKISKANNNVDMWINGTKIVHGVYGTKVLTGTIANINLPAQTSFWFGTSQTSDGVFTDYTTALFYIQDLFFALTYGETYLSDFTPATQKAYFRPTSELTGYKQNWQITTEGDCGFRNGSFESLTINNANLGAGKTKSIKVAIGVWDMDATATINVTHGISGIKIKTVSIIIFSDAAAPSFLNHVGIGGTASGGIFDTGSPIDCSTVIPLIRIGGGDYDNTNYNDAAINRGYIIIDYFV